MRYLLAALICVAIPLFNTGSTSADGNHTIENNQMFISDNSPNVSAHNFVFKTLDGGSLSLAKFSGSVVLIVNTASQCGFASQLEELQSLWERYRKDGLIVLGIPSNDFGGQEPGNASEILNYCRDNYGVDFLLTAKTSVKGPDAQPFFLWDQNQLGFLAKPRWNFHKYFLARDGRLDSWYSTMTPPTSDKIIRTVERLLKEPTNGEV